MKTSKKLICFLCCLVVLFTCASVSWSPHADAAAPVASYVASVVGSFILSAGFSFDNRGDFQSATEAFLESDIARGITEITDHVGRICALGNISEPLLICELINAGFFKDFWNSIYEFFGKGDITIDLGSTPAPADGFVICNGYEFPDFTNLAGYSYGYSTILYKPASNTYYLAFTAKPFTVNSLNNSYTWGSFSCSYYSYSLSPGASKWSKLSSGEGSLFANNLFSALSPFWSSYDLSYNSYYFPDATEPYLYGSPIITEGQENVDVIGVYNNEVHSAEDIISSWARAAENGGAIDWALDSIPAYQDITSTDKDVPVTQTQTGVLTQSGVKVQTQEEVKEEVKQEAIQELKNYSVTGLVSIFPFCIPFDIYNFFSVLTAEREAPVFDFPLNFGKLGSHNVHVDLSGWDTVAQILRTIELLAFCVALAWGTSKLIKW